MPVVKKKMNIKKQSVKKIYRYRQKWIIQIRTAYVPLKILPKMNCYHGNNGKMQGQTYTNCGIATIDSSRVTG